MRPRSSTCKREGPSSATPPGVALLDRFVNLEPSGAELIAFTVESPSGNHGGTQSVRQQSKPAAVSGRPATTPVGAGLVQARKIKDVPPVIPPKALASGRSAPLITLTYDAASGAATGSGERLRFS